MDVVFALFALLSIFWLAAAIPVLFIAGYFRTRRKGYRPPAATQVVLAGSIIGILAAYFIAARLHDRGFPLLFVSLWVPVLVAAAAMALTIWLLPKRNPRVFGTRRPRFPFALAGKALIGLTVLVCLFAVVWVAALGKAESELVTKSLNLLLFGCAFGGYLMFLGRRVQVPESLEEIKQRDQRAPVLYLRPFNQEWQFFVTGPRSRYGKYVRGVQRFTMTLGESLSDTALPADQNVGVRFEESGAGLLEWLLKICFKIPRPTTFHVIALPTSYSFPSGHALASFSFYGLLASIVIKRLSNHIARALTWFVAALLVVLIGISRIYLGVHNASDVLAGYAAALVWTTAVMIANRLWATTRANEKLNKAEATGPPSRVPI